MRPSLFVVLVLVMLAGCSEPVKPPVPAARSDAATAAPVTQTPAAPPAVASYPESPEVQALLYRAKELKDAGKFREALAAADEALARDPNSPSAKALHGELVAVVTKM